MFINTEQIINKLVGQLKSDIKSMYGQSLENIGGEDIEKVLLSADDAEAILDALLEQVIEFTAALQAEIMRSQAESPRDWVNHKFKILEENRESFNTTMGQAEEAYDAHSELWTEYTNMATEKNRVYINESLKPEFPAQHTILALEK